LIRPGCYGGLFWKLCGLCSGIAEDSVLRYAAASVGRWITTLQGNKVPSVERFQKNGTEDPSKKLCNTIKTPAQLNSVQLIIQCEGITGKISDM
jgi:hypothetical protein